MAKMKMAKIHYEIEPSFTTRKLKKLEQENKQLKEEKRKVIEYIKINTYENIYKTKVVNANDLLVILGDKENE